MTVDQIMICVNALISILTAFGVLKLHNKMDTP